MFITVSVNIELSLGTACIFRRSCPNITNPPTAMLCSRPRPQKFCCTYTLECLYGLRNGCECIVGIELTRFDASGAPSVSFSFRLFQSYTYHHLTVLYAQNLLIQPDNETNGG